MKEKYNCSTAFHTPSSPNIPLHNHSSHLTSHTTHLLSSRILLFSLYLLNSPPYLLKTPVSETPYHTSPVVRTAPYRTVTSYTAIKHPPTRQNRRCRHPLTESRVLEIPPHIHAQILLCIQHERHQRRKLPLRLKQTRNPSVPSVPA